MCGHIFSQKGVAAQEGDYRHVTYIHLIYIDLAFIITRVCVAGFCTKLPVVSQIPAKLLIHGSKWVKEMNPPN